MKIGSMELPWQLGLIRMAKELVIQMMAKGMKSVAPKWYPAMGNNDYFPLLGFNYLARFPLLPPALNPEP